MIERDPSRPMPPSRVAHFGSLTFKLAVFFAGRPDEALTTADIAIKFDVRADDVQGRLRNAVKYGIFAQTNRRGAGRVSPYVETPLPTYSAGPRLMEMVGGARQRAAARMDMVGMDLSAASIDGGGD